MPLLDTLRAAFKGGGGARVPLARAFNTPWAFAYDHSSGTRSTFNYRDCVQRAFIDNPVAQRAGPLPPKWNKL